MENVIKLIQRGVSHASKTTVQAKGQERKNENEASLLENIREVCHQLADNERWFQMECNGDLIDACIFQREALMARYRYLLALARQQGVNCSPFQNLYRP